MSLFVEVTSVDKGCQVIINLDHVVEIVPLIDGGCALFMNDSAGVNSKSTMKVKEGYDQFKQFAMQTVTAEDIARRFPKATTVAEPVTPVVEVKKATKKSTTEDLVIPKL